jgi:hypothetical protein
VTHHCYLESIPWLAPLYPHNPAQGSGNDLLPQLRSKSFSTF